MDKVKLEEETDLYNIIHDYISEMLESIIDTSITDLNNEDVAIPKHTVIAGELDEALGVTV